ncbi:MAG TPA: hypothetical protein VHD62_02890 [Opitutaceae bacterium]|nr:hypothetical protein [Opitutaceae bacterium]
MISPTANRRSVFSDRFRSTARALGIVGVAWSLGGCAGVSSAGKVALFAQQASRPMLVPRGEVVAAAERYAAAHEGDFVLQGAGRSMEPVYFAGTAIVVHPTAMHMLRIGMPVVYRNERGACVAHMLVEKTAGGWIAEGLNNAEPDEALVTADNLVGAIKQAFAADDGPAAAASGLQVALDSVPGRDARMTLLH